MVDCLDSNTRHLPRFHFLQLRGWRLLTRSQLLLWYEHEISSTGSVGRALEGNLIPKVRSSVNESIEFVAEGAVRRRRLVGGSRLSVQLVFSHFFLFTSWYHQVSSCVCLTHTPARAISCLASDPSTGTIQPQAEAFETVKKRPSCHLSYLIQVFCQNSRKLTSRNKDVSSQIFFLSFQGNNFLPLGN